MTDFLAAETSHLPLSGKIKIKKIKNDVEQNQKHVSKTIAEKQIYSWKLLQERK